mgnify:CR=1 FL=1
MIQLELRIRIALELWALIYVVMLVGEKLSGG